MKVIQENDALPGRTVFGVFTGIVVTSLIFIGIAAAVFDCRSAGLGTDRTANRPPPAEMNAMEMTLFDSLSTVESRQDRQRELLESYGWTDREAGLVRVPIERAMDLYLEKHSKEAP